MIHASLSMLLTQITVIFIIFWPTCDANGNCGRSCTECTGEDWCAYANNTGCLKGEIDCDDGCLHIDVRRKLCFSAAVPNGRNCDVSCSYCVIDYHCNLAMQNLGICTEDKVVDCEDLDECLSGAAKRICNLGKNNGECHPDCNRCDYADDCSVKDLRGTKGCVTHRNIDCDGNKCMHIDVRTSKCYRAAVPGNGTCPANDCTDCIAQFKCNPVMRELGLCWKGESVDCVAQGVCLAGKAVAQCGTVAGSDISCDCNACFTEFNCTKGSVQDGYGNCRNGNLNCDAPYAKCYVDNLNDQDCETIGFCTLNKHASIWQKLRCFVLGIAFFVFFVVFLICCFPCGSGGNAYQATWYHYNMRKRSQGQ